MNMTKPVVAVALMAMAFTACGHGSGSPTAPSGTTGASEEATGPPEIARQQEATSLDDASDFDEELAVLGGPFDLRSLWDPKAKVRLVSAPPSGSTFKVLASGDARQPVPKFKLEVVPSKNVSKGGIIVFFLTASGQECALGAHNPTVPMKANTKKQLTTNLFLAGIPACSLLGPGCFEACALPFTTTKIRLHFGGDYAAFAQKTLTRTYRWER